MNEQTFSDSFKQGLVRAFYCRWCNSLERITDSGLFYCGKCDMAKPYDWSNT